MNDYAGVMSSEQVSALEQKLLAYNDSTSTQVAIITIKSLEGYEIADYAVRLATEWGIGQKDRNNGVLILAAIDDRKITIQTGYGMEGVLTDAITRRIIELEIKPSFKAGDYYTGLDLASSAIFKFAAGEYTAKNYGQKSKKKSVPFFLIVILIIAFIVISNRRKNSGSIGSRGIGGGFFPPFIGGGGGSGSWGGGSGGGGFGGFGGGGFGGGGSSGSW